MAKSNGLQIAGKILAGIGAFLGVIGIIGFLIVTTVATGITSSLSI